MPDVQLQAPWFLMVAAIAPALYFVLTRRAMAVVTYSTLSILDATPRSIRTRLANMPALLLALAVVAMAVGLAGPRTPDADSRIRREGIAIMMVVDRSGSMQARDLVPGDTRVNRLDVVKSLFRRFVLGEGERTAGAAPVPGRPDDMIGLIAFARYADALCPLTADHGNLASILDDLAVVDEEAEDGTAVGEGLALAVERLREHPARSKVAILLTDGRNNFGDITPRQAAELASAHQVKVYCIGAGTRGFAPFPVPDPFGNGYVLRPMAVEIDEATLRSIAQGTGGHYFRATDAAGLAEIYARIDRLERSEVAEVRYLQYRQWYAVAAWAALALVSAGSLLGGTLFRRLP